ncbi:hypothetical protein D3C80_1744930 [compost metagenome]
MRYSVKLINSYILKKGICRRAFVHPQAPVQTYNAREAEPPSQGVITEANRRNEHGAKARGDTAKCRYAPGRSPVKNGTGVAGGLRGGCCRIWNGPLLPAAVRHQS